MLIPKVCTVHGCGACGARVRSIHAMSCACGQRVYWTHSDLKWTHGSMCHEGRTHVCTYHRHSSCFHSEDLCPCLQGLGVGSGGVRPGEEELILLTVRAQVITSNPWTPEALGCLGPHLGLFVGHLDFFLHPWLLLRVSFPENTTCWGQFRGRMWRPRLTQPPPEPVTFPRSLEAHPPQGLVQPYFCARINSVHPS